FSLQISDLDRSPIKDGMSCDHSTLQWPAPGGRGYWPMVGYGTKNVFVHLKNRRVIGIAQASRARRYLCEHALRVYRRARDHPQDLFGRGLLFTRFGKFAPQLFCRLIVTDCRYFGWHGDTQPTGYSAELPCDRCQNIQSGNHRTPQRFHMPMSAFYGGTD